MNKLKVLYDVVKAVRNKEVMNGVLTADIQKDQATIFSIKNEFEKNMLTGQTKAKINTQLDYEGKSVKHESTTECSMPFGRGRFHGRMPGMHHHGGRCGGLRGRFSGLAFALGVLNALEIREQENNAIMLSLEAAKLPEDLQEMVRERMKQAQAHHSPHGFMKECCSLEKPDFKITVFINANCDIEKILAVFSGLQRDENKGQHEVKGSAELVLLNNAS